MEDLMEDLKELIVEENKKVRQMRLMVDLTSAILMQGDITFGEAKELINSTRTAVMNIFPDKGDVYDLIYAPRFRRIISERFVVLGGSECSMR